MNNGSKVILERFGARLHEELNRVANALHLEMGERTEGDYNYIAFDTNEFIIPILQGLDRGSDYEGMDHANIQMSYMLLTSIAEVFREMLENNGLDVPRRTRATNSEVN